MAGGRDCTQSTISQPERLIDMNNQDLTTSVKSLQFSIRKARKSLTDLGNQGIIFKSWIAAKRLAMESLSVVYTLPWTRSKSLLRKVNAISRYAADTPANPCGWNFVHPQFLSQRRWRTSSVSNGVFKCRLNRIINLFA